MNNFHFSKIIAGVDRRWQRNGAFQNHQYGDALESRFRKGLMITTKIHRYDHELDNSKTVMIEMRWLPILRVKKCLECESEGMSSYCCRIFWYAQNIIRKFLSMRHFFVKLPKGNKIKFEQSGVVLKVKEITPEAINCEVVKWWEVCNLIECCLTNMMWMRHFSQIKIRKISCEDWIWREYGHRFHGKNQEWYYRTQKVSLRLRMLTRWRFWRNRNRGGLEKTWWHHRNVWLIILCFDKISEAMKAKKIDERVLIKKCKNVSKPIMVTFVGTRSAGKYKLIMRRA